MDLPYIYERLFKFLKKLRILNIFFVIFFILSFYLPYKRKNALKIEGKLKLPWNKPAIIIGNHSSDHDFYLMAGVSARFGRMVRGLVTEQDWKKPIYKVQFSYLGMIPRMGTGKEIIDRMIKVLERNQILGLAPEGTYSKGLVMQGFTGFMRVYFEINKDKYKVPIIPCFMEGIAQAYPHRNNYFVQRGYSKKCKITVKIGEPFHIKIPENIDKETLRKYTDYVMLKIARMGGQKKLQPNNKLDNWHKQGLDKRSYEVVDGIEFQ